MSTLIDKHCPVCGVHYGLPKALNEERLTNGGSWFCPNGHTLICTETKVDKLTRERDRLKQERARLEDETGQAWAVADTERRRAAAARGQVTKLKKRAAGGACPCCNRTFIDLRRHMETKHAGFVSEAVQGEAGAVH